MKKYILEEPLCVKFRLGKSATYRKQKMEEHCHYKHIALSSFAGRSSVVGVFTL